MNTKLQLITAATALALSCGNVMASGDEGVAFASEVNACIAAVNDHVDYDNAVRVRHSVTELKNTFSGYVLDIQTDVFTGSDEIAAKEYSSHCIAKGAEKPRKFSIDETSS